MGETSQGESRDGKGERYRVATIRDIARLSGVSIATVSRVLNNHPSVSPQTRETVQRVAADHNFKSNVSARALVGAKTGLVGVLVPSIDMGYQYPDAIVAGASEELERNGMEMLFSQTYHEHDREVSLLHRFQRVRTDGLLLVLPSETSTELAKLHRRDPHVVVIDPRWPLPSGIPAVATTNAIGAREAVEHLVSLGHRRIGAITGAPDWVPTMERLAGYHAALAMTGVGPDPDLIVEADFRTVESGSTAAARLLDLPNPPTAIFVFSDMLAVGALRILKARGLAVPEEISLVGFDDSLIASHVSPALTTVRQPLRDMGRIGTSLLVRLINGQPLDTARIELATQFVMRHSTAPPGSQSR